MIRTRVGYLTVDHAVAHELLRSDDFRVIVLGANLPAPVRWLERRTRDDLLHPLRPPSLLAVEPPEHTRYRKTVSSVFTSRAVAALRDRVEDSAGELLDGLAAGPGVVDIVERYCSQLPVAVIGDILGVPDADRPRILEFGELAAPSLDVGLSWPQYQRVQHGLAGFNRWLSAHLRHLREQPGEDLMSQLIAASEDGAHLNEVELQGVAGLVLAAGFETTVNLLGNGIRLLLNSPDQLARLAARSVAVAERCRGDPAAGIAGAAVGAGGAARHRGGGDAGEGRRDGRDLSGCRQPRSRRVRRSAPLRCGTAQCR